MNKPAKQQRIEPPGIPETASLSENRKLIRDAAPSLTNAERQALLDAWDHAMDWKDAHTLWFRHTPEVQRILDRIAALAKEKKA
jgi:hypothetical protein